MRNLGLVIVQGIVDTRDGIRTVESHPGQGRRLCSTSPNSRRRPRPCAGRDADAEGFQLMAPGRKTSLTIYLTAEQRQTLLAWQRSTTVPAGLARRSRMILLAADGMPIAHIAATVGISRRHVYKWVGRFLRVGLEGLADKGREEDA